MATQGRIKTLYSDKGTTEALFPRTKVSAISDNDGVGLDAILEDVAYADANPVQSTAAPVNADTLGGRLADEFATQAFVTNKIAEAQLGGDDSAIDLSGYATKDELKAIDFPVDSVNGKTGVVALVAEDVGAPTIEYAKKVGAPYNLLDNSYFKNPVNQRNAGGTYGIWGGYTIDRWFAGEKGATLTLFEDSIGLKGGGDIAQIIPNPQKLSGKKLTFAAKIYGRIFCCSGTVNYSNSWARVANYSVANDVAIEILTQSNNDLWVHIANNGANETYLEWAALYEGEYTAETLPEYQPKGYAAEYAECRRYYKHYLPYDSVFMASMVNGVLYLSINLDDTPMRASPSYVGTGGVFYVTSKSYVGNTSGEAEMYTTTPRAVTLKCAIPTTTTDVAACNRSNTWFALSADL